MYSDPDTKEKLEQLHEDFEKSIYTAEKVFTHSWMRRFYNHLNNTLERNKVEDEKRFIEELRVSKAFYFEFYKELLKFP